ncbi:MAG TPA: glycoside hydrolase family 2, partial [Rectinema sp.]|nr:glycoside hydrolase family 2 [Rectinema sp.]
LYTAPSDEAIIWELTEIKRMGFNMLRKHIKIEPLRWYYHCDRLGIIVWQDFVSGGGPYNPIVTQWLPFINVHLHDNHYRCFGRSSTEGRAIFEADMKNTVMLLYNTVSIAAWVPFNEGWGQFDACLITEKLRKIDSSRLIDSASGWHDQHCGDFQSRHVYYKRYRLKPDRYDRIHALTEFGGYSCPIEGHMASDKLFGYRMYANTQSLTTAFDALYRSEVLPSVQLGLSASIYTQVSDVEDEINGLFTYDRASIKLDSKIVSQINAELRKLGG